MSDQTYELLNRERTPKFSRRLGFFVTAVLILAIASVVYFQMRNKGPKPEEKTVVEERAEDNGVELSGESLEAAKIEYTTVTERPAVALLRVTGTVEANQQQMQQVTPLVAGRVDRVPVVLGDRVRAGAPLAVVARRHLGDGGFWLGLLPLLLVVPFALPFLDPPAEHGALQLLTFLGRKVVRNLTSTRLPPWQELREADGLLPFLRVLNAYRRRETLGLDEQPELARLQVADGVVYVPVGRRLQPRAIYRVPTVNLDTASAATRRGARARWGAVLNALPHPIQVVIRSTPATTLPVLDRIKAHGSPAARSNCGPG
jgi:biotin carboxyl carrier protein